MVHQQQKAENIVRKTKFQKLSYEFTIILNETLNISATDNPSFPTTTNPSINSTTTDYPETTEFPETEATETSSLPTTETSETSSTPSTSTTSEEPSVTMPSDGTTEDTSQPPFDTTTTTEIVPTTTTPGQPVYDDTCGNCDIIPQNFTCPSSYEKELYPDPFDCSVFHSCRDDGQGGVIDEQMPCAPGLVFCPKFRTCMYEVDCCNGMLKTKLIDEFQILYT